MGEFTYSKVMINKLHLDSANFLIDGENMFSGKNINMVDKNFPSGWVIIGVIIVINRTVGRVGGINSKISWGVWRKKNKYKAESPIVHNPPNKEEKEENFWISISIYVVSCSLISKVQESKYLI